MYSIDITLVLIATIFLLLYNPFMTAVFIGQRYETKTTIGNFPKRQFQILTFLIVFIGQFIFMILRDPSLWWAIYFITITILYVWDRISKRLESKKHNR